MKEIRYDRQIRLWGDHGQSSIEASSVCVLGSSALASEILKNLVLAGVHKVCIVDDARVQNPDLGQNFFLTLDDLGKFRAERVAENLKDLNPSVLCEYRVISQKELGDEQHIRFLCGFSVVVAANTTIHEGDYISDIAELLYSREIPFVYTRVYGLLGTIRISVKEHFIYDNHEENPKPDLRLDTPFSTLQQLIENMPDTVTMSSEELKHTPYLLLYFKALSIYRDDLKSPNDFPATYADRKRFTECLWKLRRPDDKDSENFDQAKAAVSRSVQPTTIPRVVMEILNDRKCFDVENTQPFWLLCYGLRRFVDKHGVLPLTGTLPDMASDTQSYTKLAKLYHEKSYQDSMEVFSYINEEAKHRSFSGSISEQECIHFCKKASNIRLQRGTSLCRFKELKPLLADILLLEDGAYPTPSVWLLLLFASLRFGLQKLRFKPFLPKLHVTNKKFGWATLFFFLSISDHLIFRFPGECKNMPFNSDFDGLKQRLTWLIEENEGNLEEVMKRISENSIKEILRFSNSEPHVVSSLIGGITAQEVIKLATNQYVPLDTTFLYDGCSQTSATFKL